jgi:DNA helicase-2/ATP-dependent DNA helicase PcrA
MTVPSDFLAELPLDSLVAEDTAPMVDSERAESPSKFADLSRPSGPLLTTAAALAGDPVSSTNSPDAWREGMLVSHPEYGLGRVLALDGIGQNRKATVDFPGDRKRKFILEKSQLQPVGKR